MVRKLAPPIILLLAFALRVVALDSVPPGWRDDEVIETTVHAQLVLDGHYPLYFIQAEGHEPIYHYLSAGWIALVGRTLFSVRLVSALFGLLTVAATYRLTRQLFGPRAALLVTFLLAVSFWALMYSRVKIRHTAELPFALLAFSHVFTAISPLREPSAIRQRSFRIQHFAFSIAFTALALYTYLAATTLLIILAAFSLYLLITDYVLRITHYGIRNARYVFLTLTLAGLLYLPLASAIRSNAERISVVGGPLTELRNGNPQPFVENVVNTLAMFGNAGDPEALYDIPGRPVFNVVGFYFFAGGLLIALWHWRDPRYAFLLIWLFGGLGPGFASNPPASFGHTITAMPVTYILATLPLLHLSELRLTPYAFRFTVGALLLAAIALHDLPDYFWRWPAQPQVRYLYKAELHAAAGTLRDEPPATYVLSGPLSKWDRVAFLLDGVPIASPPRWVNAEWAIVFPAEPARCLFNRAEWQTDAPPANTNEAPAQFSNGLIFEGWDQRGRDVIAHWRVGPEYKAVEPDMGASVASPPFPVFAFLHLIDANGAFVAGSDRFDVDAFTLQPGDRYLQRHAFDAPSGTYTLEIGLYNPTTGERTLTTDGRDAVILGAISLP